MRRTDGLTDRRMVHPRRAAGRTALLALLVSPACQTATTRPSFSPIPGSPQAEVRLLVDSATRVLAGALRSDSIPLKRVVEIDGVIESEWFTVPGYAIAGGRPLGPETVRVRAWVDVGKPGHSVYTVETVYRVYADPSRDPRELEEPVGETHPAVVKVRKVLEELIKEYGEPVRQPGDSARPAVRDTTSSGDRAI